MAPTPITIVTGFLGAGKTTLILNLIPQLPQDYTIALLKNEYGNLAVDSQLASASSISGVRELLNGCICCNLVGQLSDALHSLRNGYTPNRIFIETSGSAFPATLAIEINRICRESHNQDFTLDGVINVIDVENWKGYEDVSVTARMQARYTDLLIMNKWEGVSERRWDEVLDRVGDLGVELPWIRSDKGKVDRGVLLGVDGGLMRMGGMSELPNDGEQHGHDHHHEHGKEDDHQSEVEVLSVELTGKGFVDVENLETLLLSAPKDEVYRLKGLIRSDEPPASSSGDEDKDLKGVPATYILNWAFGRWNFTPIGLNVEQKLRTGTDLEEQPLRLTVILARGEANKWEKRIETCGQIRLKKSADDGEEERGQLTVKRIA